MGATVGSTFYVDPVLGDDANVGSLDPGGLEHGVTETTNLASEAIDLDTYFLDAAALDFALTSVSPAAY